MDNDIKQYGFELHDIYPNIYHAIVADNEDPELKYRIKLKMSAIYDGVYDYWAEAFSAPLCTNSGLQILPNKGDIVTVMFKGGDTRFPVWGYAAQVSKGRSTKLYSKEVRLSIDELYLSLDAFAKKVRIYANSVLGISIEHKVSLGKQDALYEPAVMGATLEAKLTTLISSITALNTNISSLAAAVATESTANAIVLPLLAPASVVMVAAVTTLTTSSGTIATELSNLSATLNSIKCTNTENN